VFVFTSDHDIGLDVLSSQTSVSDWAWVSMPCEIRMVQFDVYMRMKSIAQTRMP